MGERKRIPLSGILFLLESSEIGNIGINICNLYSNRLDKHVYFCTGLVAF